MNSTLENNLLEAQAKAAQLFAAVQERGYIIPGISEKELNERVHALAQELLGIRKYWHKRLVRSGINVLCPYEENPANLTLQSDDLVMIDFGPVFDSYEADFGRTYQLGDDTDKRRMVSELPVIFEECKTLFNECEHISGAEFYKKVVAACEMRGWLYGGPHAGHLIGNFPHEKILGDEEDNYICEANTERMRNLDVKGNNRHWILEIHLVDQSRQYGAFYEELLTL